MEGLRLILGHKFLQMRIRRIKTTKLHNDARTFRPHHVLDFLILDRRLPYLLFDSGRVAIFVGEPWVNLLDILCHLELSFRDKVYVVDSFFTLRVNLLAPMELPLAQIVINSGDRVWPQLLEDAVIFKLVDDSLHLATLLFSNNHSEVKA